MTETPLFWLMAGKVADALFALDRLGLLDAMREPTPLETLAERAGISDRGLVALIPMLTKTGFLIRDENSVQLTDAGAGLLDMIRVERRLRDWREARDGVLRGLKGVIEDPLDEIKDDAFFAAYGRAMRANARPLALSLMRAASPAPGDAVLDIGGADGAVTAELLSRVTGTQATVVDRPAMRDLCAETVRRHGLSDRIAFVARDIRDSESVAEVSSGATMILVCNVAHLLSDAALTRLLQTLASSAPAARLALYDMFPSTEGPLGLSDLLALDWTAGGTHFSASVEEMKHILTSCGYGDVAVHPAPGLPGQILTARLEDA